MGRIHQTMYFYNTGYFANILVKRSTKNKRSEKKIFLQNIYTYGYIARRQAWREKLALFLTYIAISALFSFWLEYITELFCDLPPTYNYKDVYNSESDMSTVNGVVVDWEYLGNRTEMSQTVNLYPHRDLSPIFPKFMLLHREDGEEKYSNRIIDACINGFNRSAQADNWLNYKLANDVGYQYKHDKLVSCPLPDHRNETGAPCFYTKEEIQEFNRHRRKGSKADCEFYIEFLF